MPSQINPNQFDDGQPVSKSALRDTLSTVKGEVEHGGFTRIAADMPERAASDKLSEWLSIRDFGAKGDGVTDESAALIRMRDYCRQDRSKLYNIHFPPGHYAYTNNTWLANIGSTRIMAYGAKLECFLDSPQHRHSRVINTGIMWRDWADLNPWINGRFIGNYVGSLIDSVSLRATQVTLKSTPVPDVFAVGRPVFVYGFANQGAAFPPNARYFQYNKIRDIDTATGILTLEDPLNIQLLDTWPDLGSALDIGPARIMSLYRPDGFTQNPYTEILGAEFLNNRLQGAAGNGLTLDGDTVIFRDIKHHFSDTPADNRIRWAYNSVFLNGTEGDKNVDHCRYEDCTLYNRVTQFSGINKAEIINCRVHNEKMQVSPRNLIVRGTTIEVPSRHEFGAVQLAAGQWAISTLIFENNTIIHDGALSHAINNGLVQTFSASAVNNAIRIPAGADNFNNHILKIFPGTLLWNADMSVCGRISQIDYDDVADAWILNGNWPAIASAAQSWHYCQYQKITESGTTFIGGSRPILRAPRVAQGVGYLGEKVIREGVFGGGGQTTYLYEIYGYLERLQFRVIRPYSGVDSGSTFAVDVKYVGVNQTWNRVAEVRPITVPLRLEVDQNGATASVDLAIGGRIDPMRPVHELRLLLTKGSSALSGIENEMPFILIVLDASPACL